MKPLHVILLICVPLYLFAQTTNLQRGNEFYSAGQYEQAEINYRKALQADPSNETAQYNLANSLYRQGKFEEAAKVNAALAKATKDTGIREKAFYNQGVAHSSLNQLDPSIAAYKNALKINPNDQQARENLEKALLQKKKENQQQQKKQSSSSMSQKQADQKLKQLQQREKELQQRMNEKNSGGGGAQDW